jgi:DNA-binding IscR family transcriptional regulator
MSTAKKSELMTKLTHQEEQLSIVHIIPQVQSLPQSLLLKTIASLSYAGLKYGDVVGALL